MDDNELLIQGLLSVMNEDGNAKPEEFTDDLENLEAFWRKTLQNTIGICSATQKILT